MTTTTDTPCPDWCNDHRTSWREQYPGRHETLAVELDCGPHREALSVQLTQMAGIDPEDGFRNDQIEVVISEGSHCVFVFVQLSDLRWLLSTAEEVASMAQPANEAQVSKS